MTQPNSDLSRFLRDVEDNLAATKVVPGDWMSEATYGSATALHEQAQDAWLTQRKGLRTRFHAGAVVGHAGPANQILKAVLSLNELIVQAVNRSLEKPFREVTDAVREELGMWVVPATRGSVVLELVCPPHAASQDAGTYNAEPGQKTVAELMDVETPASQAVDLVLSVLETVVATRGTSPDGLEEKLVEIGSAATSQLKKFAERCIELGVDVDLDDRTGHAPVLLKKADSRYLRDTIKSLGLDQVSITKEGEWRTGSWERNVFDLKLEDGTIMSGTLPKSLRAQSASALGRFVQAEVIEYYRGGAGETTPRRVLQNIFILAEYPPQGWGEARPSTVAPTRGYSSEDGEVVEEVRPRHDEPELF